METDSYVLETNLSSHDLERLKGELDTAHLPARVQGTAVVFTDNEMGEQAQAWIERLIDYNARIHRQADREGRPLERYKPRDEANLILAVCLGLQSKTASAIIHEVIWRQPFPNANHRTATAALIDELGLTIDMEELRTLTNSVFAESKKLLDGSDQSLSNREAKNAHNAVIARLVGTLQSMR